jgi:hypothetical protein
MNTSVARFAVALIGALSFSACLLGVEPPPKADPETVAKYGDVVSAKVGGYGWSVKINDTWFTVVDVATFSIGGRNTTTYMALRLTGIDRLGTFPIGGRASSVANAEVRQNGVFYNTNSSAVAVGSLTVTELSATRVAGTFTFTAPRLTAGVPGGMQNELSSMPVTDGSFSLAVYPAYSIPIAR